MQSQRTAMTHRPHLSSGITSTKALGGNHLPLSIPHILSLPQPAHDAIAFHMCPPMDMLRTMEASRGTLEIYGERRGAMVVGRKGPKLPPLQFLPPSTTPSTPAIVPRSTHVIISSLLHRRPRVVHLRVHSPMDLSGVTMGLVDAVRGGDCQLLESLHLNVDLAADRAGAFNSFCWDVLASAPSSGSTCCFLPRLKRLSVSIFTADAPQVVQTLGDALLARMRLSDGEGKGWEGLSSLAIDSMEGSTPATLFDLTPLLCPGGACEGLQELLLAHCMLEPLASSALSDWLMRTKAPHLRVLTADMAGPEVMAGLSTTQGWVAPRLTSVTLGLLAGASDIWSSGLERGLWPQLREVDIKVDVKGGEGSRYMIGRLMRAFRVGGIANIKMLRLSGPPDGEETMMAVAQGLLQGSCPRLEELDASWLAMGDEGASELARALERGAPCNATLRRLKLSSCAMGLTGMSDLLDAFGSGAGPHLEHLDVGNNPLGDEGVEYLAQAMGRGALPELQELCLAGVGLREEGVSVLIQALNLQDDERHNNYVCCPVLKEVVVGSEVGDELREKLRGSRKGVMHVLEG